MSEGFVYHFPVDVGQKMYLVADDEQIFESIVAEYVVTGRDSCDNRMWLMYIDRAGTLQMRRFSMGLIGTTIFTTRRQAEVAIAVGKVECNG